MTYYMQSRSPMALELLCRIKEPYDTVSLFPHLLNISCSFWYSFSHFRITQYCLHFQCGTLHRVSAICGVQLSEDLPCRFHFFKKIVWFSLLINHFLFMEKDGLCCLIFSCLPSTGQAGSDCGGQNGAWRLFTP